MRRRSNSRRKEEGLGEGVCGRLFGGPLPCAPIEVMVEISVFF